MSDTYRDTVGDNLNRLPETIRWQNNVTRLNQTNMNTIGSAINVFTQTFRDLGTAVTNGFNSVDSDIHELNTWKDEQLQSGDLHDYITFRDTYQGTLERRINLYTDTGIQYGSSNVFKIQSQSSELQLQGTLVRITGPASIDNTLYTSGKATLEDVDATKLTFGTLFDKKGKYIESFDDLQTKINLYTEPYDIDNREQYESSEQIPAVKFVQSALDVYEDYILGQVPDVGGGGVTENEVIELIKEYGGDGSNAIVYLDTIKSVDTNLELQDVYPIQTNDTFLKVVSKNMMRYNINQVEIQGIQLTSNNNKYLTISGTAQTNIDTNLPVSRIDTNSLPGKYVLKVDNNGIHDSSTECYILYSLYDVENNLLKTSTKLLTDPVLIDTEELGCAYIDVQMHIKCNSRATFDNLVFKIQVNYGEKVKEYTDPVTDESYSNRTIRVYTRNLYDENSDKGDNTLFKTVKTDVSPVICGVEFPAIENKLGTHYFRGVMSEDNYIQYTENDNAIRLYTPLSKGDIFTLIYNIIDIQNNVATINNVEVVHGHTDFEKYTPCEQQTIISDAEGVCDISKINWPYTFLSLEQSTAEDEMFSILLQYDPALSRNWTEGQLESIRHSAVGQKTVENGEIFNDYKNNLAGSKAFTIVGIHFDGSDSGAYDLENNSGKTLTELGLSVGDVFSVHVAQSEDTSLQSDDAGTITAVLDDINQVVVSNLFNNPNFDASKFQIWNSYLDDDGNDTEVNTFRIPAKPNVGIRSIGVWTSAKNRGTKALSKGASAEGKGSVAAGSWSHAEGNGTYAAYSSHAEGIGTTALGQGVHTEGQNTKATYWASHAEGTATQALNNSAHAEGDNTKALGTASHSEGINTTASGPNAHAEGSGTEATAQGSHAEGTSTKATNINCHAEGYLSVAKGGYSHAGGYECEASGWISHAHGLGNIANSGSQTVIGQYNDHNVKNTYFVVGNGTSKNERSNAFEVFADGHAELQTVGTNDNSVVTKGYVDGKFIISETEPINVPDGTIWIQPIV